MERNFSDVFPELKIGEEAKDLLTKVTVAKVTVTSAKDFLRIYIVSDTWIHKRYIYEIEQAIKEQCFTNEKLTVKIIEKFLLSEQYTAENLFLLYKDSILLELKNYSMFEYNLLRQAQCDFVAPDEMIMTIEESVISKGKAEELIRILEKIFCERCGLSLKIRLEERAAEVGKARKNSDYIIEQQIQAITQQAASAASIDDDLLIDVETGEILQSKEASGEKTAKKKRVSKQAVAATGSGSSDEKKKAPYSGRKSNGEYRRPLRQSDNPDVIYGKDFEDDPIAISSIESEMGEVVIRGQIRSLDVRELRNEKRLLVMEITDFTDTIVAKLFLSVEQAEKLSENIKKGVFIKLKGVTNIDRFDSQLGIGSVTGIKKAADFRISRMDHYPQKRVELHCHTKMSDMDGVSEVKDIVKQAYKWGHPAIAVTDHGAVQAFPDANHVIEDIDRAYRDAYKEEHPDVTKEELKKISHPFKVLYGVEGYLVDDLRQLVTNSKNQDIHSACVVFDLETTGFSPANNRIIEIGAVKVENGIVTDRFSTFVNPQTPIPFRI